MTNDNIEDHEREVEVLIILLNAGYRASEKKTELFERELTWLGNYINQDGVKPIKDKTEANTKFEALKNVKILKSFLQHLSKFIKKISKKTDRTDYLSRHPIVPTETTELEIKADGQSETKAEEEFVVNQIYSLFEFNQTRGSIKRFNEQTIVREKSDQSQSDKHVPEQNQKYRSLKSSSSLNGINSIASNKISPPNLSSITKLDKINGIAMEFIYKKRGHSQKRNDCGVKETTS